MSTHDPQMERLETTDHANTVLRCAWLRVHAAELRDVDPSGQLTAALFDFADLLEVARERGWFE